VWAAAAGAGTQAVAGALAWDGGPASLRGLAAGSVLAGAVAVALRALRGEARARPGP
jgi:hypothetical protein